MTRFAYYEDVKRRARDLRAEYGFTTPRVRLSDLRRIYKKEGIRVDLWTAKLKNLRGAYFRDSTGISVMIAKKLPPEQRIFTMAHELKHHFVDATETNCRDLHPSNEIEIGAEIFAVELIFPEDDFRRCMQQRHISAGGCSAEHIVRLKRETETTLSFTSLGKLGIHLGFAPDGAFTKTQWKKLEVQLFGEPVYKIVQRRRALQLR
jgi:Zn-dependent peptidase ImmA (M78 family)